MKKNISAIIFFFALFGKTYAQTYSVNIDYTSKFTGKTIDMSIDYQKNNHSFSGGFVFYTNQKVREIYGDSETGFPLSPVHFALLKNAAFAESFSERFGFMVGYKYFFYTENTLQPFISAGLVVSHIGFHSFSYTPNTYLDIPKMYIWEIFPGAGLKIKLSENLYLNQMVSPGVLFINEQRVSYFSSSISLNPMYKIGLNYRFGKKRK